jgi:CheY-like chemotaxis protein
VPLPAAERQSVLIVEDDHDIRVSVRYTLEDQGYVVLTVTNGRSALELLEEVAPPPVLILLDLMLPIMDGWEFASQLRTRAHLATIPIAVISAFDSAPALPGAVAFLKKPFSPEALLQLVARYDR